MVIIYSIRAPATSASMPPETRLAIPALVVGTALWEAEALALALALALAEAEVETAVLELSVVEVCVAELLEAVLEAVLDAVVKVVGVLVVLAEEVEVDSGVVVLGVVEVEDSVEDSVEVEVVETELAVEDGTETVEPSTVKRPMKL